MSASDQRDRSMIDASRANPARVWNYWLGGKDNYPIDQEFGEQVRAVLPTITGIARAGRGFLLRAVRHLTGAGGIRQFLQIGPGLPTTLHTHEVAQGIVPACRVVYVDHDALVLAHARALLTSTPPGRTDYLHADLRDPDTILARTLDFTQPIALLLGVLNFLADDEEAHAIVTRLLDALPAGSYLLLSHPTAEVHPKAMLEYTRLWDENLTLPITTRSPVQLTRFFDHLELLEPGVVPCSLWRPDPHQIGPPVAVDAFCGVGRKPGKDVTRVSPAQLSRPGAAPAPPPCAPPRPMPSLVGGQASTRVWASPTGFEIAPREGELVALASPGGTVNPVQGDEAQAVRAALRPGIRALRPQGSGTRRGQRRRGRRARL